jgi:hypothetical protein
MSDADPPFPSDAGRSLMDELLRAGVPEIKLALGDLIDRENTRPLPPKYARLLPETVLFVTLRPDAAEALAPIAVDLERELTASCNRHGSLYDRSYRVRLQRTDDPDVPLYTVAARSGGEGDGEGSDAPASHAAPPKTAAPAAAAASASPAAAPESHAPLPVADADATRLSGAAPAGWEGGRWVLVVQGLGGEEREAFRLVQSAFTVGRVSDDPGLRPTIAISDAPHVSRRQLAFRWNERDGAPGFDVYNLGLNVVHLPAKEIPGARIGKGALELDRIPADHVGWAPPGVPMRIGEHGPVLRVEEVPPGPEDVWVDPDATVFD